MPNTTPNFGWNLPLVNDPVDQDLWGGYLNANWSALDTTLNTIQTTANQASPAGVISAYAGTSAPTGWLLCDGSAVSRTTYATLFGVIGITHGQGDGATTFNVPDYRGRFVRGVDSGQGRDPDAGSRTAMNTGGNTGDNVGSIQADATARPNTAFTTDDPGDHTHTITTTDGNFGGGTHAKRALDLDLSTDTTSASGAHTHSITGGGDNETRPVNAYVNWIIKT